MAVQSLEEVKEYYKQDEFGRYIHPKKSFAEMMKEKEAEEKHETEESPEEEYEHAKEQLKSGVKKVKEFGENTKENIKAVAGLKERGTFLKKTAGSVLLALKPKPETEKQKRRRQEIEEAKHQGRLIRIKKQASRIAPANIQRPVQRTVVRPAQRRVQKPERHIKVMTADDMGMGSAFVMGGKNPVGYISLGNVKNPVFSEKRSNKKGKKVKSQDAIDALGLRGFV